MVSVWIELQRQKEHYRFEVAQKWENFFFCDPFLLINVESLAIYHQWSVFKNTFRCHLCRIWSIVIRWQYPTCIFYFISLMFLASKRGWLYESESPSSTLWMMKSHHWSVDCWSCPHWPVALSKCTDVNRPQSAFTASLFIDCCSFWSVAG